MSRLRSVCLQLTRGPLKFSRVKTLDYLFVRGPIVRVAALLLKFGTISNVLIENVR